MTPGFFIILCLAIAAIGVFTLTQRLYTVQSEIAIEELEERIAAEHSAQEELRVELASLEAPARISRTAREKLGMTDPGSMIYITLHPETMERVMSYLRDDGGRPGGGGDDSTESNTEDRGTTSGERGGTQVE